MKPDDVFNFSSSRLVNIGDLTCLNSQQCVSGTSAALFQTKAQGYLFDWGLIVEERLNGDRSGNQGNKIAWHFRLHNLTQLYREHHIPPDELCIKTVGILKAGMLAGAPCQTEVGSGIGADTFILSVARENERAARKWIASEFLPN